MQCVAMKPEPPVTRTIPIGSSYSRSAFAEATAETLSNVATLSHFCHIFLLQWTSNLSGDVMKHWHDDDHDDHGGLHRDLIATGVAIDRRGVLRLGARLGAAFGALQ